MMTTLTRGQRHLCGFASAAIVFVIYIFTIAPDMDFIDAGELSAVAHTFGIAHPTGYPLFTMIGGSWAQLPIGSTIFRMNLLSAVVCSVAVGVFYHLLWFALGLVERKGLPAGKKSRPKNGQQVRHATVPGDLPRCVLAAFGAIMIGLSETYWATALTVEVYSLHILMLSLVLWFFTTAMLDMQLDERGRTRRWMLFAFLLGLSFTNHMTTILVLPAIAVLHFWKHGFKAPGWRRFASALPPFLLGLLPYLYLPLRAEANPVLNWGNPQTFERFFWHVSGKQYRVWLFASSDSAKKQLNYFLSTFPAEFAWLGTVLAIAGAAYVLYRHRKLGVFLLLLFLGCVFYSINYDIHDIDSYFLLAYIVAGAWCAFGLLAVMRLVNRNDAAVALGGAALALGLSAGLQWGGVSNAGNHLVEDYTHNMFRSLKPNALVLSFQWDYWVSASYHYQYVDGLRPDVVVIDKELLRRSWYLEQLQRNHPDVYARSEREIRLFLAEAYKFERDLPYQSEVIEQRYNDMINSFVDRNYADRPVYVTPEMEQHFATGYQRIAEGLAFRLYRERDVPSPDAPVWDAFTYRPFYRTGRLIDGLVGMYSTMLSNRGVLMFQYQRYEKAAEYIRRALQFTPREPRLLELQQRIDNAMRTS